MDEALLPVGPTGLGIHLGASVVEREGWLVRRVLLEPGLDGPPGVLQGGLAASIGVAMARRQDPFNAPLTGIDARLYAPTPLGRPLELALRPTEQVARYEVLTLDHGTVLVRAEVELAGHEVAPRIADLAELAAGPLPQAQEQDAFPTCFVCGPNSRHPLSPRLLPASPQPGVQRQGWIPEDALDDGSGLIDPMLIAAVLDCPCQWVAYPRLQDDGYAGGLLAGMQLRIYADTPVFEPVRIVGRLDGSEGRKHQARSALIDDDGVVHAVASTVMIGVAQIPRLTPPG